ncbi:spore coat protein [Fredinandcohnia humi]
MNELLKKIMGMGGMTDQVIATDFLISTKAGIRNIAFAITEASTPSVKQVLREQLRHAVETHENITNFMIDKGFYYPSDLREQLQTDLQITQTAMKLTE